MPTYLPCLRQALIAIARSLRTASSRSSKWPAMIAESRSSPRVSCVMSFEPMDMPSKCSRYCSASSALVGSSHIMITLSPCAPRCRPLCASSAVTWRASATLLTNGTMTCTLVRPMASRTRLSARHTSSKQGRKAIDRKSTRLNSRHVESSYAVFCLKRKTWSYLVEAANQLHQGNEELLATRGFSRHFEFCTSDKAHRLKYEGLEAVRHCDYREQFAA